VVPKYSATTGLPTETSTVALNANHMGMSKFGGQSDRNYVTVATRLQQLISDVVKKSEGNENSARK